MVPQKLHVVNSCSFGVEDKVMQLVSGPVELSFTGSISGLIGLLKLITVISQRNCHLFMLQTLA
jgi:hypothetical protein